MTLTSPPGDLAQGVPDLALFLQAADHRGPDLVTVLAKRRDHRLGRYLLGEGGRDLIVRELALGVGYGELRAALEVYPEVEPAEGYGDCPGEQQDA